MRRIDGVLYSILIVCPIALIVLQMRRDDAYERLQMENKQLRTQVDILNARQPSDGQCAAWFFHSNLADAKKRLCAK